MGRDGVGHPAGRLGTELRPLTHLRGLAGTAQGEVLAGHDLHQPAVMQEAGAVQQLAIHGDAVDQGQGLTQGPGPVAVGHQHRWLQAAGLGLLGQPAVGGIQGGALQARQSDRAAPPSQADAPGHIGHLGPGQGSQKVPALGSGEGPPGAFQPGDPSQAVGIGERGGHGPIIAGRPAVGRPWLSQGLGRVGPMPAESAELPEPPEPPEFPAPPEWPEPPDGALPPGWPRRDAGDPLLAGLNPVQLEAVTHPEGPVLVVAGAGSGKTRVLTRRIAYLVDRLDVSPFALLAITFTNKAADEMKERVGSLVGPVARQMWVSTFHSACVRILRSHADRLGFPRSFTIYDQADSRAPGRLRRA